MVKHFIPALISICLFISCSSSDKKQDNEEAIQSSFFINQNYFGILPEGDSVTQYIISNGNGLEVKIIDYGGIITHLKVPDKNGKIEDVVLGYDNLEGYLTATPYFGAIVGRYGNRIANGMFELGGIEYKLAKNNGENHLHGGIKGFDKVVWDAETFLNDNSAGLKLHYLSSDMEEGYPGNLDVTVIYTINKNNEIAIDYQATTDKSTIVNLTQHSYFNLSGNAKSNILDHEVTIAADQLVPVDEGLIPTEDFLPVEGTPFDFRVPEKVGARIENAHEQIELAGGYDHCWILNKSEQDELTWGIKAVEPISGRVLELATTEPGVQFYTGNFLDGSITGKYDVVYNKNHGLCFEPEHYPDSPNRPDFPSVVLNPGEMYKTRTVWRFSVLE